MPKSASAVDKEWVLFVALALEAHFLVGLPQFLDVHVAVFIPWCLIYMFV